MFENRLNKYAELIVKKGVNVLENQIVVRTATTETNAFVSIFTNEAYSIGAKKVYAQFSDDYVCRHHYVCTTVETLEDIEDWVVEQSRFFVENNACFISF